MPVTFDRRWYSASPPAKLGPSKTNMSARRQKIAHYGAGRCARVDGIALKEAFICAQPVVDPRPMQALRRVFCPPLSSFPLLAVLAASTALAQPRAKPEKDAIEQPDPAVLSLARFGQGIERLTIENGLRLVLAPDTSAKTVAVSVTYGVGSRDEGPGQSGFAHLFEHMMFQGSQHVAKGQHFTLISERGGSLNGTTS